MEKPTISPQSNKLIEMCEAVLTGNANVDDLAELLTEMNTGLAKAKEDFVAQTEKQDEYYREQMQNEMDLVLQSFAEYQNGLDEISKFTIRQSAEHINNGVNIIIDATNHILDYLTVYESKSLQLGPTSFPILNMLILMTESFNKGELEEDEFRFMIYNAGQFFRKIQAELDGYSGDEAVEAIQTLRDGYNKFIEGLDKMDEGAQSHNTLIIEDSIEIIRDSQELIKAGYMKFNEQMFLSGPTDSPKANLLISAVEGHKKGTFPRELLEDVLVKYEEDMHNLRTTIEGMMQIPTENKDVVDEFPRTEEAFDLIEDGMEEIRLYLQDSSPAHLDASVEKIKEGNKLLKESKETYDQIGEKEGKISCIRCGFLNESSANLCGKCNALLPKISGTSNLQSTFQIGEAGSMASATGEEFVMTSNLHKLIEDSAAVRDGKITFEQYEKTLHWMEGLLDKAMEEAESPRATINVEQFSEEDRDSALKQKELVDDTMGLMKEGLEQFNEGIQILRQFGEDSDIAHLREGLEIVLEAHMKLQQVEKISNLAVKEIEKPGGSEHHTTESVSGSYHSTEEEETEEAAGEEQELDSDVFQASEPEEE
ncbi:MAG: hypothetical protein LWY06_03430 [Firmicutes bacterium]|nr:hypothetical protein [Bacillota bacterium]